MLWRCRKSDTKTIESRGTYLQFHLLSLDKNKHDISANSLTLNIRLRVRTKADHTKSRLHFINVLGNCRRWGGRWMNYVLESPTTLSSALLVLVSSRMGPTLRSLVCCTSAVHRWINCVICRISFSSNSTPLKVFTEAEECANNCIMCLQKGRHFFVFHRRRKGECILDINNSHNNANSELCLCVAVVAGDSCLCSFFY